MSKSLKKLIDINRLREFKNKLVGTDSAYVQTGAVDQTIAGTKTFSKPIVGSVTGSSGSCTGNADTATTLKTTRTLWGNNFDGSQNLSGDIHFTNDDLTGVVVGARGQAGNNDFWRVGGGATANNSGFMELATADDGNEPIYVRQYTGVYAKITRTATLLDASGNTQFPGTVTATAFYGNVTGNVTGNCSGSSGSCTGNAATATNAGNGVDSSGSNWIRFKNGIQICTGTTSSVHLPHGEIKVVSTTFPKSFNTAPNVIACSDNPHIIASVGHIVLTSCDVSLKSTSSGDNTHFGRYIAFGTWK